MEFIFLLVLDVHDGVVTNAGGQLLGARRNRGQYMRCFNGFRQPGWARSWVRFLVEVAMSIKIHSQTQKRH